ncbi:hypothetical protein CD30_13235 [Ureibacillus massiliensis 4400831 = CIP 108448 = CCUG 49529]|uniref:Diguanylate cyclase n=1 Tax=Ureibacillus massiliensis 4400831 = CIP 108448 = CCUG 49529 TaxID=1211035 RepID=A0A0A3IZB1_9BACL|nr:PAS domain S-box protein [Ureibacillus massiliensis]KGR90114.1 hypothetical protein CD30_13235 [Ureibacillus massiliensis 4400831 = CIP 108448 = CCUG 49529]
MKHDFIKSVYEDFSQLSGILMSAINSVKDIFYILEVIEDEYIYLFTNNAGKSHLIVEEDLVGKSIFDLLTPEKAHFLERYYEKCYKKNKIVTFSDEVEIDNQQRIYESVLTPVQFKEHFLIVTVVRDVTDYSKKITELKHSKDLLEKNDQRLLSLVEQNEDGIFMLDTDGYFLESNEATTNIIGYTPLELIGKNIVHFLPRNEISNITQHLISAIESENVKFETKIYHKNGDELSIELKFVPIYINDNVIGVYGIAKDISKEKLILEKLKKANNQLESFIKYNSDAIIIMNLEKKIEIVNQAFTNIFDYTDEEVLEQDNPTIPDWLKKDSDSLYDEAFKGNIVKDLHVKRQKKNGELLDISITLSPIFDEFGEVIAITNILRDITESKKNEVEINTIKSELELVWEYSTDGIFMIAHDGEIMKTNPAFNNMFLYDQCEKITLSDIYLNKQIMQTNEFLRHLREEKAFIQFETSRRRKDGSTIQVLATYRRVNKGKTLAIATYKDITNEKQLIHELSRNQMKYMKFLDASPIPLFIIDGEIITYLNKAAQHLIKVKKRSFIVGKPVKEILHPSERENGIFQTSSKSLPSIYKFMNLEDEIIYAETTTATIREKGKKSTIVMLRDVTTKLRSEQALRESEERFRIIAENSKSIVKIITPKGKVTYCSSSIEEILGIPLWMEMGKSIYSNIHEDDLLLLEDVLEKVRKLKTPIDIEIRHLHREGSALWLDSQFVPLFDESGEVEKIMVISDDISELKQKESKLKKMAFYDYLTGLPNRRLFEQQLQQAMVTSDKTGKHTTLFVLDGDKFKNINDTLGHDIGDKVIIEFANRLQYSLRSKDTISRIGGDEFTVVIPEINDLEEVKIIAERILKNIAETMYINGNEINITASIGIACYPSDTKDIDQLFKIADNNLYRSKDLGGNTYTMV